MTAITYFGEMLVASVLAIVLLAISPLEARHAGALFAGGAVAWTLSEYVVRRFVLHNLTPTQHALHHANPDDEDDWTFCSNRASRSRHVRGRKRLGIHALR